MTRTRRRKRSNEKKHKPPNAQNKAVSSSNARFQLQGGKIESGVYSGPHPSSFLFWTNAPDPDPDFAPFYRRALSGDLGALVDFYRKPGLSSGAAFYQCIGYLAARGSAEETEETVQKIISINRRGGPHRSSSAKDESVREWERRLLPQAQVAANWIRKQRKRDRVENHPALNRDQLWQKYVDYDLNPATPGIRQNIESGSDALDVSQPTYRISTSSHRSPKRSPALVLSRSEIKARNRSILNHTTTIALAHGIIPKELFLKLAQTTPRPLYSRTPPRDVSKSVPRINRCGQTEWLRSKCRLQSQACRGQNAFVDEGTVQHGFLCSGCGALQ